MDPEVIVIGSGFGGAITGARLAQEGHRITILERGRRWEADKFPREMHDPWVWDEGRPQKKSGLFDIRWYWRSRMTVAQAAGVGGTSLIYANVSVEPDAAVFRNGWPKEITKGELLPYYAKVGNMLRVGPIPEGQWTERTRIVREAAVAAEQLDRFRPLDLAITFADKWDESQRAPEFSQQRPNAQGVMQGTCVHLGNCVIGCDVRAKNTLDLNYIPLAEQKQADVRPMHVVRHIEQEGDGYRVHFDVIDGSKKTPGSLKSRIVIVAAGSLGSTEILLRSRDQYKGLPRISQMLGKGWSSNGDFLTPAYHPGRSVWPTHGPTISAVIDFSNWLHPIFIQDGGMPDIASEWYDATTNKMNPRNWKHMMLRKLVPIFEKYEPFEHTMPWFAQAKDAANGQFTLERRLKFLGRKRLTLDWDAKKSTETIDDVVEIHKQLADLTGSEHIPAYRFYGLLWHWLRWLITPHPLGGCGMAADEAHGVVNHRGEVFNYPGLFVIDGAMVPEAIGANPSKTIGALAERSATLIHQDGIGKF